MMHTEAIPPAPQPTGVAQGASALRGAGARQRPLAGAAPTTRGDVASLEPLLTQVREYLPAKDIKRIRDAYRLSDQAHLGQFRSSGDPYITHPIAVAQICAGWHLDSDVLMAALLHDVLEDTGVTKLELNERFGPSVAEMVDGLSKLDKIEFGNREQAQAESFRKMLLAMARDVRVILVKLADRLHNMRTLDAVSRHRQLRIASETAEIYAPIANRLGLHSLYRELQDLSFRFQYPIRYDALFKAVQNAGKVRRDALGRVTDTVEKALAKMGVTAEISSREKSLYSIYRKMVDKKISFSEVTDLFGIRLVVPDLAQCYLALGALHNTFKPNTSRFKDFIAIPKANGYQSLHTTVVGPHGGGIEFQIRTREMHQLAEAGVAAHWLYKADGETASTLQIKTLDWLKSLLDIQQQTGDSLEFIDHVKVDLYPDAVYVFTPKGQIRGLPRSAPIVIQSVDGISLQCAPCCHPVPGDRIAGHMRGGHGLAIHRIDCDTAKRQMSRDAERWMEVEWGENISGMFRTLVEVSVHDERGVLGRVAGEIAAHDANIVQVSMDTDAEQMAMIKFTLQVRDRQHLADVFRGLRRLPQFRSLSRH